MILFASAKCGEVLNKQQSGIFQSKGQFLEETCGCNELFLVLKKDLLI